MKDYEIFEKTTLQDLFKEIHQNQKNKRVQLDLLISDLTGMITSPDDAVVVVPMIKEYFEVGVKNDEQLVKIASIVTRIIQSEMRQTDSGESELLSDDEKEQLMSALSSEVEKLQTESKKINKKFESGAAES